MKPQGYARIVLNGETIDEFPTFSMAMNSYGHTVMALKRPQNFLFLGFGEFEGEQGAKEWLEIQSKRLGVELSGRLEIWEPRAKKPLVSIDI